MENLKIEIVKLLLCCTFTLLATTIIFVWLYIRHVRNTSNEQKKNSEIVRNHKKDLLQNILESIETERARIAMDLHDQIGNVFSLISLFLQQAENEKAAEVQSLIGIGLSNTRELVYQIMPPDLKLFGLEYALEEMCTRINKSEKLTAECFVNCTMKHYNPQVQLSIYRIIQELVSNTIKHSNASRLTLNLYGTAAEMKIEYNDNGTLEKGNSGEQRKGYGLKNIENRVQLLNGSFEYSFKKGFESSILIKNVYAD